MLWVFILELLTCFSENLNLQIFGSTNGVESANNCILCYLFKSYRNNSVYVTDCYWVGKNTLQLRVSPRRRIDCKVLLVIISQHLSWTFSQNCFILFSLGILYGTMTLELGGIVNITCQKTGYSAILEFKLKVSTDRRCHLIKEDLWYRYWTKSTV